MRKLAMMFVAGAFCAACASSGTSNTPPAGGAAGAPAGQPAKGAPAGQPKK